jgi:hypothetical protein
MSEFSQPGLHPDPDALSAFLEGVLPEHERQACLAHLAECAECREVVSLAQDPAMPDPLPVAGRAGWWKRWMRPIPVLSAGAVAGILVLSVSLYRLEQSAPHAAVAVVADATEKPLAKPDDASGERPAAAPLPPAEPRAKAVPQRRAQTPVPVARDAEKHEQTMAREPIASVPAAIPRPQPGPASVPLNGQVMDAPAQPAAIAGTITDPAGAVVPGAAVQVRSISGTASANAFTDTSGQFQVAGLQPGQYEVQITKSGFQTEAKKVDVQKDQMVRADSTLLVGSVSQAVEVTASAPALDTESASVAKTKSGLASLPVVGRIVARKAEVTPGVATALPSKLPAVATVTRGKTMLTADSAGALYRSDNAGKAWKLVKAQWPGKVVALSMSSDGIWFQLKTEGNVVWMSKDGSEWVPGPG